MPQGEEAEEKNEDGVGRLSATECYDTVGVRLSRQCVPRKKVPMEFWPERPAFQRPFFLRTGTW